MSDVNQIASTKIASSGASAPQALKGSSTSGVLAGGAANFWDMIIAQFGVSDAQAMGLKTGLTNTGADAAAATKPAPAEPLKPAATNQPQGSNPLALLQVALASQTIDEQGNIVLTADAAGGKLQTQLDLTNQIINHLKNMLPENGDKNDLMKNILGKLQAKSDTLQASLSALNNGVITKDTPVEDIPLPMMIALGLNPSEISQVSDKVQELEQKLGRDITVEDLIAGVGGIIPPSPPQAVVVVAGSGSVKAANNQDIIDSIDENSTPTDDLAAQLNALNVGAGDKDEESGITNMLKDAADTKEKGLPVKADAPIDGKPAHGNTDAQVKKDVTAFKENLVNMMNANKAQQGDMVFPATSFGADTDAMLFQPYGLSATPSLSYGSTAQAANMVSSPAVAGQATPATQMVAATLTKSAKNGTDSTINLRLDPPELGNVNVRLSFGKDKTMKAHITVEKPETFMMLQREGHTLERALQSAGLDTNAQSISFELAQDNSAFKQNNGNEGNSNFGGGGNGSQDVAGADEIIQSSVTWQVDPSTGRVRYNIFA